MRRVEVSPYQVRWVSTFEEEADRLRQTFGDEVPPTSQTRVIHLVL